MNKKAVAIIISIISLKIKMLAENTGAVYSAMKGDFL